jgi:hypothetical protein
MHADNFEEIKEIHPDFYIHGTENGVDIPKAISNGLAFYLHVAFPTELTRCLELGVPSFEKRKMNDNEPWKLLSHLFAAPR